MDSETPENSDKKPGEDQAHAAQTAYLRGLAKIAREENLSELEVEFGGARITLKAPAVFVPVHAAPGVLQAAEVPVAPAALPTQPSTPGTSTPEPHAGAHKESLAEIVSPMIGIFYRAPSPADPNFIEIGDRIEVGQTVALVEAMKVFNEITSEVSGSVVEIKAQNSDLVETGQVIITVRP